MFPELAPPINPDRAAILAPHTRRPVTSFRSLEERSRRLAHLLHDSGLRRGDAVAVLAPNDPRYFEVLWATRRSGLYFVAIDRQLRPEEVSFILRDAEARALIVGQELRAAAAEATSGDALRLVLELSAHQGDEYERALDGVADRPLDHQPAGATMLYSSGTTGRPKGICPPLPNRQAHEPGDHLVRTFAPRYGFDHRTVFLTPAPLHHSAPLRLSATVQACGGTVLITSHFDPGEVLELLEAHRVTHSLWVPTHFVRLLKHARQHPHRRPPDLRLAIHAAAPCPVPVKRAMIDWWGPILEEYYGATESMGLTSISSAEWLERPGSVGRAVLGIPHICDSSGRELPPGEEGTIYFERDHQPFAYHRDPERTRQAQHPQHLTWMTVGDQGYLDADDYLFLTGRRGDLIISGGINVHPAEVEASLILHPAVADVGVIGVNDEDLGQRVCAVIQVSPGTSIDATLERTLKAHARERLARHKVPRELRFVDDLPRTASGKIRRAELRDLVE